MTTIKLSFHSKELGTKITDDTMPIYQSVPAGVMIKAKEYMAEDDFAKLAKVNYGSRWYRNTKGEIVVQL